MLSEVDQGSRRPAMSPQYQVAQHVELKGNTLG